MKFYAPKRENIRLDGQKGEGDIANENDLCKNRERNNNIIRKLRAVRVKVEV